ncbi:hypothetical protein [Thermocatellispora tengchongensis]|uniref:hypothetical protein n=1 Tax=Thermocatellispora tengchongensis TaxID=1073253 RepID=UPI00363A5303
MTLDARSFLLAGAERAAGEERAEGAFWYSRVRTFKPQPSGEVVVSSEEVWYDGETGRGRITTGLDAEIILPGESGGAGKAKGTPKPEPETRDFDMRLLTAIGGERLSQDDIRRLPDDVAGLRRWLDAHRAEGESETGFVFAMTRFVLSQPTTPATRAAMLRILADQPGLKLERGITDPLGRPGAAVTSPDGEHRLIVDESGARLLAEEYHGPDRADKRDGRSVHVGARKGEKTVYESSGWTEKIGDRP